MVRVNVDVKGWEYIRFLSAEPKKRYENGQRTEDNEVNEKGETIFNVSAIVQEKGSSKPETITVKVPMPSEPNIPQFSMIGFVKLSAFAWASNNRANLSFSADKVGVVKE